MVQIDLSPAAIAALDSLSPKDKKTILRSLEVLSHQDANTLKINPKIKKLMGEQEYFSIRASKDLRVIFEYSKEKEIHVLDIIRHSTLEKLYKRLNQE